ncbi:hypothetical protein XENOCAPTIV_017003 [Xenoophorus captivus]|uniref:Uncharacterized protein n=1 Tax=Xenoophorus captivus TaxID=1517983 RepID=A0ABV0RHQ4_9TELE
MVKAIRSHCGGVHLCLQSCRLQTPGLVGQACLGWFAVLLYLVLYQLLLLDLNSNAHYIKLLYMYALLCAGFSNTIPIKYTGVCACNRENCAFLSFRKKFG